MPNEPHRVEIITSRERRLCYSAEQKLAFVGETMQLALLCVMWPSARAQDGRLRAADPLIWIATPRPPVGDSDFVRAWIAKNQSPSVNQISGGAEVRDRTA